MRHLDLFSGIGGFALAARNVGWQTVAFCESEPFCQAVLRKHWPDVPIHPDVRELTADAVGSVDIITGGYPCQPFSSAGKRRGEADDRFLWPEFARLVRELRPRWAVGENVADHVHMGLDRVLSDLEGFGYACEAFVIPACAVGARHRRDRVWITAHADGEGERSRAIDAEVGRASATVPHTDCELAHWRRRARRGRAELTDRCRWEPEPDVARVVDGLPGRMDRVRALGNAIVPQVATEIFRAIKLTEFSGERK